MKPALHLLLCACTLVASSTTLGLPRIPKGMTPREYYGGFYPDEKWVAALTPLLREQRKNPFQSVSIVEHEPEGKAAWPSPVVKLTKEQLDRLKRDARAHLAVEPARLLDLVPRRNRISGNARVMRATRMPPCPSGDGGMLEWTPDRPDEIRCPKGHVVDPIKLFPPTGAFRVTSPKGEVQEYLYHDAGDGTRTFVHGEYMDALRVGSLCQWANKLGQLYAATGKAEYASRAAAILLGFAQAVPHWPKIHRGIKGVTGRKRFRPVDEYTTYAGIWYDKYHTGLSAGPDDLALAYDFVASAPVWDELDALVPGRDAREVIERDLFLYTARDAIRYDVRYPKPSSALSNYIPYQIRGMICIGRAAGLPELVHYACWKQRQLAQKTLMADGVFPESPSYARQHVYGMARACALAQGYSDPPGFTSTIDHARLDDLDLWRDIPELGLAVDALESMVYPDDNYTMVHDTYSKILSRGHPAPAVAAPLLYPSWGHAALARGERSRRDQTQAHLHYSGNWGHDHLDMLGLVLWAYGEELVSDIGYAHTYRQFATWSSGHNLVVVDRRPQRRVPDHGRLVAWHPGPYVAQFVQAESADVYPQCTVYRRALCLVPLAEGRQVVLDVFEVAGGHTHEWMAQGSCMTDQTLHVSVPTAFVADSYGRDRESFTPPAHNEYVDLRDRAGLSRHRLAPDEPDPWYGVFRNVHKGRAAGPLEGRIAPADGRGPSLRVHVLQPADADVYTCTVPSLRRCYRKEARAEVHALVETFRMPKLILRRDGANLRSRFVAVWEPLADGEDVTQSVVDLAPGHEHLVAVEARAGDVCSQVFYSSDPDRVAKLAAATLQGRCACIVRSRDGASVALYDCSRFESEGLAVSVDPHTALPVVDVGRGEAGGFVVRLDGTWPGVGEGLTFDSPRLAMLDVGQGQRVFPVSSLAVASGHTRLRCARDPGFTYDGKTRTLADTFSPFLTYRGRAMVRLPSRVWLRREGQGPWQVRGTMPAVVNGKAVPISPGWQGVGP